MTRAQVVVEIVVLDEDRPRLQDYATANRQVMIDPGGDDLGIIGTIMSVRTVYGVPVTELPALGPGPA